MPKDRRDERDGSFSPEIAKRTASDHGQPDHRASQEAEVEFHAITPPAGAAPFDLRRLLDDSLVLDEDLDNQPASVREELWRSQDHRALVDRLAELGLLTAYQARRIRSGKTFGLMLGHYRVLNQIGAGGMGLVFKAEHIRMRRPRAIKVVSFSSRPDPMLVRRFRTEFRVMAEIQHPNIVAAIDAGEITDPLRESHALHYFVMEYVPGHDLEELVELEGPLTAERACDLAYQVASALAETHKHNLVHRDIKPSNIRVTPEGQAKLLDFGLARDFRQRGTEHGTALGTIAYMAPEQVEQAARVDARADIYGLGATLYWCLTGQQPFPEQSTTLQELLARLRAVPAALGSLRPSLPAPLVALVERMMALDPDDRHPNPGAVLRALLPFLPRQVSDGSRSRLPVAGASTASAGAHAPAVPRAHTILITDDEAGIRLACALALEPHGLTCLEAAGGAAAQERLHAQPCDLMLLDIDLAGENGLDVLRAVRAHPPSPHFKVIMISGHVGGDDMAHLLAAGADDYLVKPFTFVQLHERVEASLRLKDAQDRMDQMQQDLLAVNADMERGLQARDSDLAHARNALVLALAKLAERRSDETGQHLFRMQKYTRCLAEAAAGTPAFGDIIDENYILMVECCAPLHDIGKVGLPDHILLKPTKLTLEERIVMQTHTTMGAETLAEVARRHSFARGFLQMAIEIVRHHHERWDGTGYPDQLAGTAIPLAARLVSLADVYDALRSRRTYKPALSHGGAVEIILGSTGQFDPALLEVFRRCVDRLDEVARGWAG